MSAVVPGVACWRAARQLLLRSRAPTSATTLRLRPPSAMYAPSSPRRLFPASTSPSVASLHTSTSRPHAQRPSSSAHGGGGDGFDAPARESSAPTGTDISSLDVLGGVPVPASAIAECRTDGFKFESGAVVAGGDAVLVVGGEAFAWRPHDDDDAGDVVTALDARAGWDVPDQAWGVLKVVWPRPGEWPPVGMLCVGETLQMMCMANHHHAPPVRRPDLLIVGTGKRIRRLSPRTVRCVAELGVRVEVLDTRNATAMFNMLAQERGVVDVAAALLPIGV